MEVRFKFSADIYIEGESMKEIREKFENMQLFSQEAQEKCSAEFSELLLVEDADTNADLQGEYDKCYDEYDECDNCEYTCPKCGHIFEQGEYNYNYDTGHLDFECPECDWSGTENGLKY